jgi:hypothetical protein
MKGRSARQNTLQRRQNSDQNLARPHSLPMISLHIRLRHPSGHVYIHIKRIHTDRRRRSPTALPIIRHPHCLLARRCTVWFRHLSGTRHTGHTRCHTVSGIHLVLNVSNPPFLHHRLHLPQSRCWLDYSGGEHNRTIQNITYRGYVQVSPSQFRTRMVAFQTSVDTSVSHNTYAVCNIYH